MKRLVISLLLVLALGVPGVMMTGCEDEGSNAAAEFGAQEGQRPKPAEKRAPPGPQDSDFKQGEDAGTPPDDDGGD